MLEQGTPVPAPLTNASTEPLYRGADWDFPLINRIHEAIEEIALKEFGLNVYPNQIEVITTEQMLDAYSSIGMPLFYKHWSFGKHFARNEALYKAGMQGLAYEIVINTSPCIVYIMEENTITMQALVIAHAGFGHNHFFKNNYLFKQWTDATGMLDYLEFARNYVLQCIEKHGEAAVERTLDAAHALMRFGVDRFQRGHRRSLADEKVRAEERQRAKQQDANILWSTLPKVEPKNLDEETKKQAKAKLLEGLGLTLPDENLLYVLEKGAPKLETWQRELLRIVRKVAQYFYPQGQTKVMNEGCATYVHYKIMNRLYDKGLITEGAMLEFLSSHTNVVFQPAFDDRRYSGINPYALGFAMMQDIERICTGLEVDGKNIGAPCTAEQLAEDREWFPQIAGNGKPWETLRDVWENYRDESFILQYLSPKVMRHFKFFHVQDKKSEPTLLVRAIPTSDNNGYRKLRKALAAQYDMSREPDIATYDFDIHNTRELRIEHKVFRGVLLEEKDLKLVLDHLAWLWGYKVKLLEIDADTGSTLKTYEAKPPEE